MENFILKNFFHSIVISEIFSYNHHKYGVNIVKTSRKLRNLRLENNYKNKTVNIKKYIPVINYKAVTHVIDIDFPEYDNFEAGDLITTDHLRLLENIIINRYPEISDLWKRGDYIKLTKSDIYHTFFYNGNMIIEPDFNLDYDLILPAEFDVMIEFPPNYWSVDNIITVVYSKDKNMKLSFFYKITHDSGYDIRNILSFYLNEDKVNKQFTIEPELYDRDERVLDWVYSEEFNIDSPLSHYEDDNGYNFFRYSVIKNIHKICIILKYDEEDGKLMRDYTSFFKDKDFHKYIIDLFGNSSMTPNDVYFISNANIGIW